MECGDRPDSEILYYCLQNSGIHSVASSGAV